MTLNIGEQSRAYPTKYPILGYEDDALAARILVVNVRYEYRRPKAIANLPFHEEPLGLLTMASAIVSSSYFAPTFRLGTREG